MITEHYKDTHESYWIGLRKVNEQWKWPNGNLPNHYYWRITQPDRCCGFDVNCVLVNYGGNQGEWDDADCKHISNFIGQGYVCKKNATL